MELYPKNQKGWFVVAVLFVATVFATEFIGRYVAMMEDQLLKDVGLLVLALFLPCVLALATGRATYQWLSPKYRSRIEGGEPNQTKANTRAARKADTGEDPLHKLAILETKDIQKDVALDQLRLRLVDLREIRDDISGTGNRLENTTSFAGTPGSVLILDKFQQWTRSLDALNSRIEEISTS